MAHSTCAAVTETLICEIGSASIRQGQEHVSPNGLGEILSVARAGLHRFLHHPIVGSSVARHQEISPWGR